MAAVSTQDSAYSKEAVDIAKTLGADLENGLSTQEAASRLANNGRNELQSAPPTPAWRRVLAQFQDPLIYLLLAAIGIALVAWGIEGFAGWPIDALVIAAVVLLNGALGYFEEAKARDAVAALRSRAPVRGDSSREARGVGRGGAPSWPRGFRTRC